MQLTCLSKIPRQPGVLLVRRSRPAVLAASRFSAEGRAPCYEVRETFLRLRSASEFEPGIPCIACAMPALTRFFAPSTQPGRSSNHPRAIQTRVKLRPSAYHAVRRLAPEATSLVSFNQARPWGSVPFRACPNGNHRCLSAAVSPPAIGRRLDHAPFRPEGRFSNLSPRTPTYPRRFRSRPLSVRLRPRRAFACCHLWFRFIDRVSAIAA